MSKQKPIHEYGVFRGVLQHCNEQRDDENTPHYILIVNDGQRSMSCKINIKSRCAPHDVAYCIHQQAPPDPKTLLDFPNGFTALPYNHPCRLDYLRQKLINFHQIKSRPADAPGPDDDMNERLAKFFAAAGERGVETFVFGYRAAAHKHYETIHEIHMNQAHHPRYHADNKTYNDGAVFLNAGDNWMMAALLFQSQATLSDFQGYPTIGATRIMDFCNTSLDAPLPPPMLRSVQILSVQSPAPQMPPNKVTIKNTSNKTQNLRQWRLHICSDYIPIPDCTLEPKERRSFDLPHQINNRSKDNQQLSLALTGYRGAVVDYVSYSIKNARELLPFTTKHRKYA